MPRKSRKHALLDTKLERVKRLADWRQSLTVFSAVKSDPESSPDLLDYAWVTGARSALKIEDRKYNLFARPGGGVVQHELPANYVDEHARELRQTFEKFNLDPDDPWSWRMMAVFMSMIFAGPQSKRGRPKVHTPERLKQLYEKRESAELKKVSDSEAARRLAKNGKGGTSRGTGVEGMRKTLRKARRSVGTK